MNVRRAIWLAASTVALLALPLVIGCGDDDGTGTSGLGLVGSWRATSIQIDDVEVLAGTDLSVTMTFGSDGTYSSSVSGDTDHLFCDTTTSCTETGTYIHTSMTFTVCDPGCDEAASYTISGNTLTVTLVDVDLGVTWRMTGVRI
jgi:hypothetical protein